VLSQREIDCGGALLTIQRSPRFRCAQPLLADVGRGRFVAVAGRYERVLNITRFGEGAWMGINCDMITGYVIRFCGPRGSSRLGPRYFSPCLPLPRRPRPRPCPDEQVVFGPRLPARIRGSARTGQAFVDNLRGA